MSKTTVAIEVDEETAQAYGAMSGEERRKIQMLLGLWLRDWVQKDVPTLEEVMDEIGRNARARGLTPEIFGFYLERSLVALCVRYKCVRECALVSRIHFGAGIASRPAARAHSCVRRCDRLVARGSGPSAAPAVHPLGRNSRAPPGFDARWPLD
jgi:hypothetical protein